MADSKIKVFLIDDHQIVLDGLKLMLDYSPKINCIGIATSGPNAIAVLHHITPDVILLDIEMPDLNGIETCKRIKKKYPSIKIIALTMLIERSIIQNMLEAGAEGFLIKNASQDEVVKAIHLVNGGSTYYSEEVRKIIHSKVKSKSGKTLPKLSRRETEILRLIIQENTTQEIASQLFISPGTVETHRKNIMRKFQAKNVVGVVKIALENNLV